MDKIVLVYVFSVLPKDTCPTSTIDGRSWESNHQSYDLQMTAQLPLVFFLCWFDVFYTLLFNTCKLLQLLSMSFGKVEFFNIWKQSLFFSPFSFFISSQFQRKTVPLFEKAKTSGCTLANLVISERIYPNWAWSNTIPLWLLNGFCIIHLNPYNNTGSLGTIFRFTKFPCRDRTLSGWERSFSAVFVCAGNIWTDFSLLQLRLEMEHL